MNHQLHINSVLGDLPLNNTSVNLTDKVLDIYHIFETFKASPGIILLNGGKFHGLLSRVRFFEIMSRQFMYDLYSRRRIEHFFEGDYSKKCLILSSSTSIISATDKALKREGEEIFEPIIVTGENNEYRLLDFYQLLVAQNTIQLLMNQLLDQANEFKKEVLAITTHDLRNPIGTILGFSDLMTDTEDLQICKEYAQLIHKTAMQMEELVNGFLVSTINDSIEYNLELSNFDIEELILSVIKDFEYSAGKKNQNILFESQDDSVMLLSDRIKIKEILENLISNAIKYSERNKKIIVKLEKEITNIQIAVKDNGPGFSESDLQKIFGKFQKLSAKPTDNESSTGLGLYITKKLIAKLNGSINIKSQSGKGTTFTINLPLRSQINHTESELPQTCLQ